MVTAIRHNVTVEALGFRRERHADRYLKPPAEMHRLLDLGVDGIMTDRADVLKDVLQQRGQWTGA